MKTPWIKQILVFSLVDLLVVAAIVWLFFHDDNWFVTALLSFIALEVFLIVLSLLGAVRALVWFHLFGKDLTQRFIQQTMIESGLPDVPRSPDFASYKQAVMQEEYVDSEQIHALAVLEAAASNAQGAIMGALTRSTLDEATRHFTRW